MFDKEVPFLLAEVWGELQGVNGNRGKPLSGACFCKFIQIFVLNGSQIGINCSEYLLCLGFHNSHCCLSFASVAG